MRSKSAKHKAKHAFRVLRSFINTVSIKVGEIDYGINVSPEPGSGDTGNFEVDLSDTLLAVGDAAKEAGKHVCILIDELQYVKIDEFEALIMSIHKLNQKNSPRDIHWRWTSTDTFVSGRGKIIC